MALLLAACVVAARPAGPSPSPSPAHTSAASACLPLGGARFGRAGERRQPLGLSRPPRPSLRPLSSLTRALADAPPRAAGAGAEPTEPGTQVWEMTDGGWDGETGDALLADGPEPKRTPADIRCFDRARLCLKAGNGGDGCVAFLREKYRPMGGPAGGNGGKGGDIYAVVDPSLNSLLPFRKKIHYRAGDGLRGGGKSMHGESNPRVSPRMPLAGPAFPLANACPLLTSPWMAARSLPSVHHLAEPRPRVCHHASVVCPPPLCRLPRRGH